MVSHWDRVFEHGTAPEVPRGTEFHPAFRWFVGGQTNLATTRSTITSRTAAAATPR